MPPITDIFEEDMPAKNDVKNDVKNPPVSGPLIQEKKLDFRKYFNGQSLNLSKKTFVIFGLYLMLILSAWYLYSWGFSNNEDRVGIMDRLKELPWIKENNQVLEWNLQKAKEEYKALESIKIEDISQKQNMLRAALPDKNNIEQMNRIYTIANEVWLKIKKLTVVEWTEDTRKSEAKILSDTLDKNVGNFLDESFYVTYTIETKTDEKIFMDFIEKLNSRDEFITGPYTISPSDEWVAISGFQVKWFYPLSK